MADEKSSLQPGQHCRSVKQKKPAVTRILLFFVVCFGASLGFRLLETTLVAAGQMSENTGHTAHAQTKQPDPDTNTIETADASIDTADDADSPVQDTVKNKQPYTSTSGICEPSVLMTALQTQERGLAEKAVRLQAREKKLDVADKRIRERLEELETARAGLEATIAKVAQAAAKDVQHLVDMYSKMKPKQAGEIFNAMQPDFAAGFMGEMKPDTAAAILSSMEAGKAHAVSVVMAGRNANTIQAP